LVGHLEVQSDWRMQESLLSGWLWPSFDKDDILLLHYHYHSTLLPFKYRFDFWLW
jgi:hypothetical protein